MTLGEATEVVEVSPGSESPPEAVPVFLYLPRPPAVGPCDLVPHVTVVEGRRGPDLGRRRCVPVGELSGHLPPPRGDGPPAKLP